MDESAVAADDLKRNFGLLGPSFSVVSLGRGHGSLRIDDSFSFFYGLPTVKRVVNDESGGVGLTSDGVIKLDNRMARAHSPFQFVFLLVVDWVNVDHGG